MVRRFLAVPAAAGLVMVACVGSAVPASAHAVQKFGPYTVAIGWQHEPAYTGQLNAVQLFIKNAAGDPVSNLSGDDLHVQVSAGGVTGTMLNLEPGFDEDTGIGTPGEYDAPLIPTLVGDYTFLLSADLHGTKVQQSFTSGATTFASVTDATPIEFPQSAPSNSELASRITRDAQRLQDALSSAHQASDAAGRATVLAIVAVAVGVLAVGAGLLFGRRARRRPVPS